MKTKLALLPLLLALATLPSCQKEKPLQKELQLSELAVTTCSTQANINITVTYPGKLTATLYLSQSQDLSNPLTFTTEKNANTEEPYDFTITATGLQKSTDFWCQVEVGNSFFTKKTEIKKFTTLESDIMVTTSEVSNITNTTADCGGSVLLANDEVSITTRGVCWSTSHNPTISDNHTSEGSAIGSFTSILSNLIKNTTYYVRAYASSTDETVYGNVQTFSTTNWDYESYTISNVTFNMLPITGGTYTMGATPEQGSQAESDEKPAHSVTLSDFYMGETEVTQALWQAVMGNNPSHFKGDNLPIERVSWNDCQEFITKLNTMLSSQLDGKRFALPTEAEWEYAARSGQKSQGYKYSGSNTINEVAWYTGNSNNNTHPLAQKQANELGLYDMSGNVFEWCADWYGSNYYSSSPQNNPTGPSSGSNRVRRGGSWDCDAGYCRVSYRSYDGPGFRDIDLGLRLSLR